MRCKNGAAVNFPEDYMRRRDPDSMRIGDGLDTDKPRFEDVYGYSFDELRTETFRWLTRQELILVPFKSGGYDYGYDSLLVCPRNAAFFGFAMAQLQAFVDVRTVEHFKPRAVVYAAPPFRHTHFGGKQVVVHCRRPEIGIHEVFSYNLYPGPSAKKGIYAVLIDIGEQEGWVTAHASSARIITPYENEMVMMHEGASGGGKSELLQDVMRSGDGRVLLGVNLVSGEESYISMSDTCTIEPVTDDMAMCPPSIQDNSGKLVLTDGEDGWFVRVDGITSYGCDPQYEKISISPSEPLMFLNLQAVPRATCLPWEHSLDSDGRPCPNPRVIVPRRMVKNVVNAPVEVDVRSFGVRMPPATAKEPTYGIMGLMQIVPPALAWLWRLVARARLQEPQHLRRDPARERGRRQLLALRHRQARHAGEPAPRADSLLPEHPLRAHTQPAHRLLPRRLRRRVDSPRIPRPARRRQHEDGPPHPRPLRAHGLLPQRDEGRRPAHIQPLPPPRAPGVPRREGLRQGRRDTLRLLRQGPRRVRPRADG